MLSLYRRGGGQVVSVVIFYSNDLSLNPAEVFIFCSKLLEKNEINEKVARNGPLTKLNKMLQIPR